MTMTKQCRKCKKTKSVTDFSPRKDTKDKLHSYCKRCIADMMNKLYAKNPQKYLGKMQKKRDEIYEMVNKIKSDHGCCFCDEKEPIALDFHHKDPTQKDCEISKLIFTKNKKRILAEIEKCIVICANHHRKLEAGLIFLGP